MRSLWTEHCTPFCSQFPISNRYYLTPFHSHQNFLMNIIKKLNCELQWKATCSRVYSDPASPSGNVNWNSSINWNFNINWNLLEYVQAELVLFVRENMFTFEGLGREIGSLLCQNIWKDKQKKETEERDDQGEHRISKFSLLLSAPDFQSAQCISPVCWHGHLLRSENVPRSESLPWPQSKLCFGTVEWNNWL